MEIVEELKTLIKKRYNELMFDLELFDLFPDEIMEKWHKRCEKANEIL